MFVAICKFIAYKDSFKLSWAKNSYMACVLKKIFIPCSGKRATSTPSPILWSSPARCGVKHREFLPSTQSALSLGKHTCQPSSFQMGVEVDGGSWPPQAVGRMLRCLQCVLQEAAPEFLRFTPTQNPGDFCLFFFLAPLSPLCLSPSSGEGSGNSQGAPGCS